MTKILKLNIKQWIALSMIAVLLLTGVGVGVVLASGDDPAPAVNTVTIQYGSGKYLPHGQSTEIATGLFEMITTAKETTEAGTLILPGTKFSDTFSSTDLPQGIAKVDENDSETFYFGISVQKPTETTEVTEASPAIILVAQDGEGTTAGETETEAEEPDPYADLWAYTFTGWMIFKDQNDDGVNDITDKIPGETVFQPGDVIRPDTLQNYVQDGTLKLEALWGKCYFIQNPYEEMKYALLKSSGYYGLVTNVQDVKTQYNASGNVIAATASSKPTGASDENAGNNPKLPKATVDGLYAAIRTELGVDANNSSASIRVAQKKAETYDCYSRVVMLVGDLDYITDNNYQTMIGSTKYAAKFYGYADHPGKLENAVFVSATYKSLGERNYTYLYKPRGYANTIYGNFRMDNVNHQLANRNFFGGPKGQTVGNEFTFSHITQSNSLYTYNYVDKNGALDKSYIEITARYNDSLSGATAASTFRCNDATYVVVNGGTFGGMQNQYSTGFHTGKQLYWTVGRKARITTLTCGTTTSYENNVHNMYINYKVYLLGGRVDNFYGGNNGLNTIAAGRREIVLLGDGAAGGNSNLYDPQIANFFGGAMQARLFGDITIEAKNCTKLGNIYGGGQDYSATTYGNISIDMENCIVSGNLYGGGKYGNCEITPSEYVQYRDNPDTEEKDAIAETKDLSELSDKFGTNFIGSGKPLVDRIGEVGGDVTVKLNNTSIRGNVYGSGMGASQILNVRTQMGIIKDWFDKDLIGEDNKIGSPSENMFPSDAGEWEKPVTGYPSYNPEDGRVFLNGWREGGYSENSPETMSYYNYHSYAYLSLATVRNVDIVIENGSVIGTENNGKGNVYGGGSIAKVLEDTKITIEDSTIWGAVYGGGDGVTQPADVTIYWPEDEEGYVYSWYEGSIGADGKTWAITWHNQSPTANKRSAVYSWSNNADLLDESRGDKIGIDEEAKEIYSPNTEGLGAVLGNTSVTVKNSFVKMNVYGGGNHGMVQGNTSVTISGTTQISNQVFGGGNGDVSKDQTNILGVVQGDSSLTVTGGTIGEAYGGCNAADVNGTVTLNISGGQITDAYGANNQKGAISGLVTVNVTGGSVKTLYGGGNVADYVGTPSVYVTGENAIAVETLFGGGNLADVATGGGNITKTLKLQPTDVADVTFPVGTYVCINAKNAVISTLYGGGNMAAVGGTVEGVGSGAPFTEILDGTVVTAYGGNNESGTIYGENSFIIINGGKVTEGLYGGGNKADQPGVISNLHIDGGEIGDLNSEQGKDENGKTSVKGIAYGGGREASVKGTRVIMTGGKVRSLFGGSLKADILGYNAYLGASTLGVVPEPSDEAYSAHVAVIVDILGGEITTFLGGNDNGGAIIGDIIINVGDRNNPDTAPAFPGVNVTRVEGQSPYIRNFFGGGNEAEYSYKSDWQPALQIRDELKPDENFGGVRIFLHSGEIYQVFGGGVLANISNSVISVRGGLYHFIYGGGFMGDANNTAIHMRGGHIYGDWLGETQDTLPTDTQGGYIFAGGYDGYVKYSNIHMAGGTIHHSLFGGGNLADVGYSTVVIKAGTVRGSVYGGGYRGKAGYQMVDGKEIALENGGTSVEITGGSIGELVHSEDGNRGYVGNIYGGGFQGICSDTHVDVCELRFADVSTELKLGGSIFGGGHNADVAGNTHIHFFTGSIVGNVYGGGRNGNVLGECFVDIFDGDFGDQDSITGGNIYGGGLNGTANATHVLISDKLDVIMNYLGEDSKMIEDMKLEDKDVVINVKGSVFGGGEGETATVYEKTNVLVDMDYHFQVEEKNISAADITSGQITSTLTPIKQYKTDENNNQIEVPYSVIEGNVYGGGDLGRVGDGEIKESSNTATVTKHGQSSVTLRGGHIMGSVFGGGSGVPKETLYKWNMGAVFGSTDVYVTGGYVEGNIYGGGTQSRVYADGAQASSVSITEVFGRSIAIGGSVFGGGDRGSQNTSNATIPTTVGNVEVKIIGRPAEDGTEVASQIYFLGVDEKGGVYGDGNFCLVKGQRTILMQDFHTASAETLKTFYSLQRADTVTMVNSDVVLLGAVDLVEEGDTSVYSINRVGKLYMREGSTIKLDQVVKYLGYLESDVETDREFIKEGHNGVNGYGDTPPARALTSAEIDAYHGESFTGTVSGYDGEEDQHNVPITHSLKNTVCVANGLYLDIKNENGAYGTVKGLFTLQLLFATPGEGGGYVYANIKTCTGDFICTTSRGLTYTAVMDPNEDDFNAGHYYRRINGEYIPASDMGEPYNTSMLYYSATYSAEYMDVVDDIGGYSKTAQTYSFYYWFISGSIISYSGNVTGHIGADVTEFKLDKTIPMHKDNEKLYYILYDIAGNPSLEQALTDGTYNLVQSSEGLSGQMIALELRIGDQHIGYLTYTNNIWGVQIAADQTVTGYEGVTAAAESNTLSPEALLIDKTNCNFTVVLHKALAVNTERTDMGITVEIDLFEQVVQNEEAHIGSIYSSGTSTLRFEVDVAIVRLVPVQDYFSDAGKSYIGVNDKLTVNITGQSSLTLQYQTKYFPRAFPYESGTMQWLLSAAKYSYYMDDAGHYMTLDAAGNIVNMSSELHFIGELEDHPQGDDTYDAVYILNGVYYCRVVEDGESVNLPMSMRNESVGAGFPVGTKITMIDLTFPTQPAYYYYIVQPSEARITEIDLKDFYVMGTNTKISALDDTDRPAFMKEYYNVNSASRVTENLVFIVDFVSVNWEADTSAEAFASGVDLALRHLYKADNETNAPGKDIMDYVKADDKTDVYIRSTPILINYTVESGMTGLENTWSASFTSGQYYDRDTMEISLSFAEDEECLNTLFEEGNFSLKIELLKVNESGTLVEAQFPIGIDFYYVDGDTKTPFHTGVGRRYAIVPLKAPGNHTVEIKNALYSLYNDEDITQAVFRLTVYSSPDANYYDVYDTVISQICYYSIVPNPSYSISANTTTNHRIFAPGEAVSLNVDYSCNSAEITPQSIAFTVEKKNGTVFEEYDGLFRNQPTQASAAMNLQIDPNATGGTYRLKFVYGNRIEYLYLIVRDE